MNLSGIWISKSSGKAKNFILGRDEITYHGLNFRLVKIHLDESVIWASSIQIPTVLFFAVAAFDWQVLFILQ
jgi:hypothetical protein